jgi:type IV pilus assembly protein PilC
MPVYKYTAIDGSGTQKSGSVTASSTDEASAKLSKTGLMVTSLNEGKASAAPQKNMAAGKKGGGGFSLSFGKVLNQEGLALFTRQLSTLLQSGLPLLRSLEIMERQEAKGPFKLVLADLCDNVRSGNPLSDGLAMHPKVFDNLFINMVKAGEAGGILDTVLSRLAGFMEKSVKTKKKVKSAMVYPVVVLTVAVLIVALLMVVVVPQFEDIFNDMLRGASLPLVTQIVIGISNFVQSQIVLTVLGVVALIVGGILFKRTTPGKIFFDTFSINVPKFGDIIRKGTISRFTRTFGTLLSSGVPILQALTISRDVVGNVHFTRAITNIHDRVRDGESLATPMDQEKVFPSMVTSMIDVGEETGELPEMLNRIADNYDEDVDNAVSSITSIIEPIMIVFLAVVVGFIVIALFLPIVRIIEVLSG